MSTDRITSMYSEVLMDIDDMADKLMTCDTGDVWPAMTCGEVESIAKVLRTAGRDDAADFILAEHSVSDEEDDDHYNLKEV